MQNQEIKSCSILEEILPEYETERVYPSDNRNDQLEQIFW
jgi:hypothetical protein